VTAAEEVCSVWRKVSHKGTANIGKAEMKMWRTETREEGKRKEEIGFSMFLYIV